MSSSPSALTNSPPSPMAIATSSSQFLQKLRFLTSSFNPNPSPLPYSSLSSILRSKLLSGACRITDESPMSRVLRVTGGSFIIQAGITLAHALLAKRIDTRTDSEARMANSEGGNWRRYR
ncbi:hypothetical protein DL95DRAFT_469463 [Leptodontidium sp. 2 PMI_412]|nr:hypothetical protein DL95DRAFT_469463 [Leptodontidium sp. 2 PMI_412]